MTSASRYWDNTRAVMEGKQIETGKEAGRAIKKIFQWSKGEVVLTQKRLW